ncbi:hypothetical protein [Pseudomonas phage vB_PseuGesM_254]|uniref:Uncharacterized protein n=1 Tax=Pseudomonas phage vB_PseuGesM_254 TaxID=3092638 RepID=A0AAX4G6Q6_9CAUD|nr:hypothetical protein [Pseudomonas phage PseuGes_254]
MKTANVKARVKDIRQGVTLYTAHPIYGINKYIADGRPFMEAGIGLFVNVKVQSSFTARSFYLSKRSLCDAGISPGNSYNGRRTFFKLKHAEAWVDKWATDKGFIADHARHESWCEADEYDRYYSDY